MGYFRKQLIKGRDVYLDRRGVRSRLIIKKAIESTARLIAASSPSATERTVAKLGLLKRKYHLERS